MNYLDKRKISAIYFDIFISYSWSPSFAYKLTADSLLRDESQSYWSTRFTKAGYVFAGSKVKVGGETFAKISGLFNKVPASIFKLKLPRISEPGNKDECTIFIQIDTSDGNVLQFKIDECDGRDLAVDQEIIEFKDEVKRVIESIMTEGKP